MFGVRVSSSTSSSNYPLEVTALTVVSSFSGGRSKLQHFLPEYEAKRYEGRIKEGGILLSAHCDTSEQITLAKAVLKQMGAEDISSTGEASADTKAAAQAS